MKEGRVRGARGQDKPASTNDGGGRETPTAKVNPTPGAETSTGTGGGGNCRDLGDCGPSDN